MATQALEETFSEDPAAVTHIKPGRSGFIAELREVWKYRELFYFLVWRDVKVRYKQTILGVLWAMLQPFVQMVIFSIIFGRFAGIGKMVPNDIPYPLFVFAALVPWQFFAGALTRSSASLVGSSNLITRVYFPRVIVPAAAGLSGVVDFFFAALVMGGMMVYYGFFSGPALLALPALVFLAYCMAVSIGLCFSALHVRFRDVGFIVPFFVQIWFFASPVIYPLDVWPEKYRPILALNPMTGIVEGFRWSFLGGDFPAVPLAVSCAIILLCFLAGQWYFRRVERSFADVV
jgi:lipopolysaccharide transport system permease protein